MSEPIAPAPTPGALIVSKKRFYDLIAMEVGFEFLKRSEERAIADHAAALKNLSEARTLAAERLTNMNFLNQRLSEARAERDEASVEHTKWRGIAGDRLEKLDEMRVEWKKLNDKLGETIEANNDLRNRLGKATADDMTPVNTGRWTLALRNEREAVVLRDRNAKLQKELDTLREATRERGATYRSRGDRSIGLRDNLTLNPHTPESMLGAIDAAMYEAWADGVKESHRLSMDAIATLGRDLSDARKLAQDTANRYEEVRLKLHEAQSYSRFPEPVIQQTVDILNEAGTKLGVLLAEIEAQKRQGRSREVFEFPGQHSQVCRESRGPLCLCIRPDAAPHPRGEA